MLLLTLYRKWLTRGIEEGDERPGPAEAVVLRATGLGWLIVIVFVSFAAHPRPGFHGRGPLVILGIVLMFGGAVLGRPRGGGPPGTRPITTAQSMTIVGLACVIAGSGILALVQSSGIWLAGPYFVAVVAATTLDRIPGAVMLFF